MKVEFNYLPVKLPATYQEGLDKQLSCKVSIEGRQDFVMESMTQIQMLEAVKQK